MATADDKLTEAQVDALVDVLVAGKYFCLAPLASDAERSAAKQLVRSLAAMQAAFDK